MNATVFACNALALSPEQRARHGRLVRRMREEAQVEEWPDGYAFVFAPDASRAVELAEFMTLERLCCPFLHLVLEFRPNGGELRLRLMGTPGVKPFLAAELELASPGRP